ncbi:MAG: hypothetical protein CMK09_09485 [Ponticaulis sp.]|nr:hypothetical protein [Ponticaulis sp.]|tara:strand:- start:63022 stop:63720 length:699 start_codon:yes stop_codon:yes gene_type:complete
MNAFTPAHAAGPAIFDRPNWPAALADQGFVVIHDLIPSELTHRLRHEAIAKHASDRLEHAGVGRVDDYTVDLSVRRDKTRWFDRSTSAQCDYLDLMETVRQTVNRELFLGLFSYEAHFAVYEPGGFYRRHVDAFRGTRNRMLSSVFYLNEDWQESDDGALVIYPVGEDEAAVPLARILPASGTLVLFLSEEIPHEVLPTTRDRYSIAGWFRVNDRMTAPGLQAPPQSQPGLG